MSERCKHGKLPENPCWECDEEHKGYQTAKQPLTMNWIKRMVGIMPEHNDHFARETLEELRHVRREIKELKEIIMVAQSTFDTSLQNLTNAVVAVASALATTTPTASTPDSVVTAYVAGVDAQTLALATATPPPAVTPTPAALAR